MKVALPLGFAILAVAFMLLLPHAPPEYNVDRLQPLVVVTYWQQFGAQMCTVLFAGLALATIGYVALLRKRHALPNVANIAVLCGCCAAFAIIAPVVFSSDVYAYAAYGALANAHVNPYVHAPIALRTPLLDAAQWQWGNPLPACVYGPIFVVIAAIAASLQSVGASLPLFALRIIACVALALCAPLAYHALWWLPKAQRFRAAALIALNPLAVWCAAEGHNDAIALAVGLGAIALARSQPLAGALVAAAAGAIKVPALFAAGVVSARARTIVPAAIGGLLCVAAYIPLIEAALHNAASGSSFAPHFSPAFLFAQSLNTPAAMLLTVVLAALVGIAGRGRIAFVVFALWMCVPNPYPWYGLWLLPFAAVSRLRLERDALVLASLLCGLRYYGEATSLLPVPLESTIVLLAYGIPGAMLVGSALSRLRLRENRTAALGLAPRRLP